MHQEHEEAGDGDEGAAGAEAQHGARQHKARNRKERVAANLAQGLL